MTPIQRKLLRDYALAALGSGAVAVSLYFGVFNTETGTPAPIEVDGQTIEFTWTDDNSGEDLIIFTDKMTYTDGLSGTTVYAAVTNLSDVAQDVELQGYFVNERRSIKEVSVLTEATFQATSTELVNCRELTGRQILEFEAQGFSRDDFNITETTATGTTPRIFDVCEEEIVVSNETRNEWVELPQRPRDLFEVAREQDLLVGVTRKQVQGYIAQNKTFEFPIQPGRTLYYKLELQYPVNDEGNFYLEAIGSQGAYGHLDPWFDAGWLYRKQIDLTGQTGAGTNYQVKLQIGASSGGDFHLEGNSGDFPAAKGDGGDLRFTDNDETTELDFWVEEVTGGVATVWVEVADDLGSNQTIYVYYGNAAASNASDGAATFPFFDDFDGSSLDTTKWVPQEQFANNAAGAPNISGSEARYNHTNGVYKGMYAKYNWSAGYAQIVGGANISRTTAGSHRNGGFLQTWTGGDTLAAPTPQQYFMYWSFWNNNSGNGTYQIVKNGGSQSLIASTGYINNPGRWEYRIYSNNDVQVMFDNSQIRYETGFTSWAASMPVLMYGVARTGDIYMDYVISRKFNDTEPTFSTAGIQEENVGGGDRRIININ